MLKRGRQKKVKRVTRTTLNLNSLSLVRNAPMLEVMVWVIHYSRIKTWRAAVEAGRWCWICWVNRKICQGKWSSIWRKGYVMSSCISMLTNKGSWAMRATWINWLRCGRGLPNGDQVWMRKGPNPDTWATPKTAWLVTLSIKRCWKWTSNSKTAHKGAATCTPETNLQQVWKKPCEKQTSPTYTTTSKIKKTCCK